MAPRSNDEKEKILRELATLRGQLSEEDDRKVDRIEKLVGIGRWIIGGIVAVTLSVGKLYSTVSAHDEALKDMTPKVAEMWFMKQQGISNKEAYQHASGYPVQVPSTNKTP